MRATAVLFLAASLAVAAPVVQAQTPAEALRAEPKVLTLKELPAHYRAFVSDAGNPLLAMSFSEAGASLMAASALWVDPEEWNSFLEGRLPRLRALAIEADRLGDAARMSDWENAPLFTERWIEKGGVTQWSPVRLSTREFLTQALEPIRRSREAAKRTAALSNVKQLATGVMLLLSDSEDRFPKVNATAEMHRLLQPYTKNEALWTSLNPNGGRILYNVALSGLSVELFEDLANVLLFWEENAWPDGYRTVAFADGHAKRLDSGSWNRIWSAELSRRAGARIRR